MDKVQALLQALKQGNDQMIGYGKDFSNVARLAVGMPELYSERQGGPMRDAAHDFTTWNKLRELFGYPPMQDPNAQSPYVDGRYVGAPQAPQPMPQINLPYGVK